MKKLLETELDYDKLKAGNGSVYNGTAWLNDELNSKNCRDDRKRRSQCSGYSKRFQE